MLKVLERIAKGKQKKGNAEGIAGNEANHTLGDGFTTIFIEVHLRPAKEPTNAQNLGHHRPALVRHPEIWEFP